MKRVTFLLAALLFPTLALADVLFLDLNDSPKEIEAARKAAQRSGRKLVVLPDPSGPERQNRERLRLDVQRLDRQMTRSRCDTEKEASPACKKLEQELEEKRIAHSTATDAMAFDSAKLQELLAARAESKKPFDSIVVSGHDGTGTISGTFGSITDAALADILSAYPEQKNALRSLHLWGCYTTSAGSLLLNWKRNFPNVSLITGYDGRAPLNDKPAGWHYLAGVLEQETKLITSGDSKKLQRSLFALPSSRQLHAAIYACGEYASITENYNLNELESRCQAQKKDLLAGQAKYECYLKALPGCENPPDTSTGFIRNYYNLLQKTAACYDVTRDEAFVGVSRDQAIRLTLFNDVKKNFARVHRPILRESDEILKAMNAPDQLRFSDLEGLSRADILKRADALLAFIRQGLPSLQSDLALLEPGEKEARLVSLLRLHSTLTNTLVEASSHCVPFNWVEPNATERSNCVIDENLGHAGVAKVLKSAKDIRHALSYQMTEAIEKQAAQIREAEPNSPLRAARLSLLDAQLHRLDVVRQSWREVTPAEKQFTETRIQWAEAMVKAAEKGAADPRLDPAAAALARSYNLAQARRDVESDVTRLTETYRKISESPGEGEKKFQTQRLEEIEEQLMINRALIAVYEATGEGAAAATEKLAQLLKTRDVKNAKLMVAATEQSLASLPAEPTADQRAVHATATADVEKYRKELRELEAGDGSRQAQRRIYNLTDVADSAIQNTNPFGGGMYGNSPPPNRPASLGGPGDGSNVRPDNPDELPPQAFRPDSDAP